MGKLKHPGQLSVAVQAASSGDNTILAAVTDKKIRVLSLFLICSGPVTARFEDGAGGSALSGQFDLLAGSGIVLPHNPEGWFETTAATLLNLELSAAVKLAGTLNYDLIS